MPLWEEMNQQPRRPAADLREGDIPIEPGVYAWYENGSPVYVGKATSLRQRIWKSHMGRGASMRNSAFRRNVAEDLGIASAHGIFKGTCRLTAKEVARVNERVRTFELAWLVCDTPAAAENLEGRMKAERTPPLTKQ